LPNGFTQYHVQALLRWQEIGQHMDLVGGQRVNLQKG
jgi:hypothetical protein